MRDPDGRLRRWVDELSTPTRVITAIVIVAVVVAVIAWG
jgi:hypothetical protein